MKCLFEKGEHDIMTLWADERCRWCLPLLLQKREGCAMTSYETIMVIIAILNLLIAVYKINRK